MREIRTSGSMRGCRRRAARQRACALLYGADLLGPWRAGWGLRPRSQSLRPEHPPKCLLQDSEAPFRHALAMTNRNAGHGHKTLRKANNPLPFSRYLCADGINPKTRSNY